MSREYTMKTQPRAVPKGFFLYCQELGDDSHTLPDGSTTTTYALLRRPLPTDAEASSDYEEKAVTDTSEAVQIDRRFVLPDPLVDTLLLIGAAYAHITATVKGDGTYATYITKVTFDLETVDSNNTYTSFASKTITFSTAISTTSTSHQYHYIPALLEISQTEVPVTEEVVLRIRIYGYMDTGGTSQAIRLYYTRGSADSYVELPVLET